MDNLILIVTEKNEDAFNLFYELRNKYYAKKQYSILQSAVFYKNGDLLEYKDGFNQHENGLSYLEGGLIGGLIGVLLGPFGILIGTMVGVSVAQYSSAKRSNETVTLFQLFHDQVEKGNYCVLLHVDEQDALALDAIFSRYQTKLVHRREADSVYQELTLAHEYKSEVGTPDTMKEQGEIELKKLEHKAQEIEKSAISKAKQLADSISHTINSLRNSNDAEDTPPAENTDAIHNKSTPSSKDEQTSLHEDK